MVLLKELSAQAARAGFGAANPLERYLVLGACLAALPRLKADPIDEGLKREFCAVCRRVALPPAEQDHRYACDERAFLELAEIVTLRRYTAGQHSFNIMRASPGWYLWWFLMTHPTDLPRLLREIIVGLGVFGRVVAPHLCYWRAKPMFMLEIDHERSMRAIARIVERDPSIRGLVGVSWFYSETAAENTPHLAWAREFFVKNNAMVVDMGPADPDIGFKIGSRRRRQLYAEGVFRPRQSLVLWRRADILAWAKTVQGEKLGHGSHALLPHPHATHRLESGQFTLANCVPFLYFNKTLYVATMLVLPALTAAVLAALYGSAGLAIAVFFSAFVAMWLFQYYFLQ